MRSRVALVTTLAMMTVMNQASRMTSMTVRWSLLAVLYCAGLLDAGEYNSVLSIGDSAPAWNELPGVDGATHSLDNLRDRQLVVVAFTCNTCPYAVDYEDRMVELAKKYRQRVAVVAINVNQVVDDLMPAMKRRAEEKEFPFPYLRDDTQKIARDFGAMRTPEFFVLDKQRKVAYMGALDDSADSAGVRVKYVEDAIEQLLAGQQPQVSETVPIGCAVRYQRQRRKRSP